MSLFYSSSLNKVKYWVMIIYFPSWELNTTLLQLSGFWSLWTARIWRALSIFAFWRSISVFCLLKEDSSSSSVSLSKRRASILLWPDKPGSCSSPLRSLKSKFTVWTRVFVSSIQNIQSLDLQTYWTSFWRPAISCWNSSIFFACSAWTQRMKPSGSFRHAI